MPRSSFHRHLQAALAWRTRTGWPDAEADRRVATRVLGRWRRDGAPDNDGDNLTRRLLEALSARHADGSAPVRAVLCRVLMEAYLRRERA